MKLVNYLFEDKKSYGVISCDGIIDLKCKHPDKYTLRDFLEYISEEDIDIDIDIDIDTAPDHRLQDIKFLPVIENPRKIICAGMNYKSKKIESGENNLGPTLFIRFPDSQTGHLCELLKPAVSREFDYEGELAVIIGRHGRNIAESEASCYIAGYSCYMDGSVRDWQHSWFTAGKNWPETAGFGPWLVTKDEIPDPQNLYIETRLNGNVVQSDRTSSMVLSISKLIEYISSFTHLSPGDVILTGSPDGIGKKRTPPLFLFPGDIVEVEIEKIGCLENHISEG